MIKLKNIIFEHGLQNITKLAKRYKQFEIYFHEDADGMFSAIAMKNYLERYGLKMIDCHTIQYGNKEFEVKKPTLGVLAVLVDFAIGKVGFHIHTDHHLNPRNVQNKTATHFAKSASNLETISGVISPTDIFPADDVKWINVIDSADFFRNKIKPSDLTKSIFTPNLETSILNNKKMMAFVINRIITAFKNKDNVMTDTVKSAKSSLLSVYQTIMKKVKNTDNYKVLDQNLKDYIKQMSTYEKIKYKDGIIIQRDIGSARKIGSYDRYLTFEQHPNADFRIFVITQFGFIQVSANPFKKKMELLNLVELTNSILEEYKSILMKKLVSFYSLKKSNAKYAKKEDIGYNLNTIYSLYKGKIWFLNKNNYKQVKAVMEKPFSELTDEDKQILYVPKIPLWWIVTELSGGHKSIANIQGLNFLWDEKDKIVNEIVNKIYEKLQELREKNPKIFGISDIGKWNITENIKLKRRKNYGNYTRKFIV